MDKYIELEKKILSIKEEAKSVRKGDEGGDTS